MRVCKMLKVIFNTSKKKKEKKEKRGNTNATKRKTHAAAPISCWPATCLFAIKYFIRVVMDAHGTSTFF